MPLVTFDHVNIRTARLQPMIDFYVEVLGLRVGPRPPFDFGGAWLYCGERPFVHLVEVAMPPQGREPRLEHFAFQATDIAAFLGDLARRGIGYRIVVIPGFRIIQVNLHDPDGNHLHVDFPPAEQAALERLQAADAAG